MTKSRPAPHITPQHPQAPANDVSPSERFVEERLLGRGAVGTVYLVRDRETGEQLALKKLFGLDAKSVLRLKREFRTLADVRHPNLVKLYELGHEHELWFLTMEYVPGVDLNAYLGLGSSQLMATDENSQFRSMKPRPSEALARVASTFQQLASGVNALHRARRAAPRSQAEQRVGRRANAWSCSTSAWRCELDERSATVTEDGNIAGTPAYMAPEQAHGQALTEASDWYAFGTMLYEALTGVLPFDGALYEIVQRKLDSEPIAPIELDPEIAPQSECAVHGALGARAGRSARAAPRYWRGSKRSRAPRGPSRAARPPDLARYRGTRRRRRMTPRSSVATTTRGAVRRASARRGRSHHRSCTCAGCRARANRRWSRSF